MARKTVCGWDYADGAFVGDNEVGFKVGSLEVGRVDGDDVAGLVVGILLDGEEEGVWEGLHEVGAFDGDFVGDNEVGSKVGSLEVGRVDGGDVTGLVV
eukprot:gene41869-56703_t